LNNFIFTGTNGSNEEIENHPIISHLSISIKKAEEKLNELKFKKEYFINCLKTKKDDIERPLDEMMNNENFEKEQTKYMNNRMKRISMNTTKLATNESQIDEIKQDPNFCTSKHLSVGSKNGKK
jgi:hypothetical protein